MTVAKFGASSERKEAHLALPFPRLAALEENRIVGAADRLHILRPDHIEVGNPSQKPTENAAVEVLVGE